MMSTKAPLTLGFDIGGTNLRGAVVDRNGTILDSAQIPTPSSEDMMERGIVHVANKLRVSWDIEACGLAIAGFIDPDLETVSYGPHVPWRNAPVRERLESKLGIPVRIEHDANSAAWGEYRFGAAMQARTWVLFAIGTGIGATLMVDGNIYRGAFGVAPEFGHLVVVPGGRSCSCGKNGCLERYCSGTALEETAREVIGCAQFEESELARAYRDEPEKLSGRVIMAAAKRGDPAALAVVNNFAMWLGHGLSIVSDVLDPELIVIAGGVADEATLYLDKAQEVYSESIVGAGFRRLARLKTAELGSAAGMIGVSDLAREAVV
ncbi:ROK family protein [Corynebacterium glucuronolyticum]|uniref:ROK family protein n=1 Tax=Corynebacterium glucuronolyticum TaxID=39791 RepID=UPI00019C1ED6|nr:ROK family protein [Corynebacterium glucuronolyticum]EEI26715.1 ROK family protein [Corynebacterium glucuronolyticum ATCC 51867]QRO82909.1 ROK family protein [Corynebacterium glucuronolyticum]